MPVDSLTAFAMPKSVNEVVGLDVAVDHIGLTGIDERQDMGVFLEIVGPGQDRSQAFKGLCHDWILTR